MDISITRAKEKFWDKLTQEISFTSALALDVGCGDGSRSVQIAKRCRFLNGIDPDQEAIALAKRRNITNASFEVGSIESARLRADWYDLVFFTLSLHHVATESMVDAINAAIATCKKNGRIVFIEPDHEGSLYEAEVLFSACDGDERKAKQRAEEVILTHPHLRHETLITDETQFRFRSFQAFVAAAHPKRNLSHARDFLKKHEEDGWFVLRAPRKIWVCSPRETA